MVSLFTKEKGTYLCFEVGHGRQLLTGDSAAKNLVRMYYLKGCRQIASR